MLEQESWKPHYHRKDGERSKMAGNPSERVKESLLPHSKARPPAILRAPTPRRPATAANGATSSSSLDAGARPPRQSVSPLPVTKINTPPRTATPPKVFSAFNFASRVDRSRDHPQGSSGSQDSSSSSSRTGLPWRSTRVEQGNSSGYGNASSTDSGSEPSSSNDNWRRGA